MYPCNSLPSAEYLAKLTNSFVPSRPPRGSPAQARRGRDQAPFRGHSSPPTTPGRRCRHRPVGPQGIGLIGGRLRWPRHPRRSGAGRAGPAADDVAADRGAGEIRTGRIGPGSGGSPSSADSGHRQGPGVARGGSRPPGQAAVERSRTIERGGIRGLGRRHPDPRTTLATPNTLTKNSKPHGQTRRRDRPLPGWATHSARTSTTLNHDLDRGHYG